MTEQTPGRSLRRLFAGARTDDQPDPAGAGDRDGADPGTDPGTDPDSDPAADQAACRRRGRRAGPPRDELAERTGSGALPDGDAWSAPRPAADPSSAPADPDRTEVLRAVTDRPAPLEVGPRRPVRHRRPGQSDAPSAPADRADLADPARSEHPSGAAGAAPGMVGAAAPGSPEPGSEPHPRDAASHQASAPAAADDSFDPSRRRGFPGSSAAPAAHAASYDEDRAGAALPDDAATSTADEPTRSYGLLAADAPETEPAPDPAAAAAATDGSLRRTAFWTILTTLIPGTGLLTTRRKALGWLLLLVVLGVLGAVAYWYLQGAALLPLLKVMSDRRMLFGALVALILVAAVWWAQILLTRYEHARTAGLRGGKRWLSVLLALAMVALVLVPIGRAGQYVWAMQGLLGNERVFGQGGGTLGGGSDPWAGVGRINVMLLGQDAGEDRTGTRPDTIMVASIDTETGRTALFSVPRNLQNVRFPAGTAAAERFPDGFDYFGGEEDLINAVWTWANDEPDLFPGDPDPGLTATRWAVEESLGLDIDYYAMVDLQGFSQLVDAIGGVDMNVERQIPIGGGTNLATGGKYPITGYIEPGPQHLNGDQALWYARSREGSSDFNRLCRQQRMVQVVTLEADPTTLALNFTKLVGVAGSNIETDVPADDVDAFVELAWRVKEAGFASYPIQPGVDLPERVREDRFLEGHPDWDFLKAWVQESIDHSMEGFTEPAPGETTAAPSPEPTTEAPQTAEAPAEGEGEETPTPSPDANAAPSEPAHPLAECLPEGATDVRG